MLFGLGLGLIGATGIYFGWLHAPAEQRQPRAAPSPTQAAAEARATTERPAAPQAATASRFDFYEELPRFEVVVHEVETAQRSATAERRVDEPGRYVVQAGSFKSFGDADRQKANIGLLGIESQIQVVSIDDAVYHRVRIGPISDLEDLNRVRRRLRDAGVEALLLKVND